MSKSGKAGQNEDGWLDCGRDAAGEIDRVARQHPTIMVLHDTRALITPVALPGFTSWTRETVKPSTASTPMIYREIECLIDGRCGSRWSTGWTTANRERKGRKSLDGREGKEHLHRYNGREGRHIHSSPKALSYRITQFVTPDAVHLMYSSAVVTPSCSQQITAVQLKSTVITSQHQDNLPQRSYIRWLTIFTELLPMKVTN